MATGDPEDGTTSGPPGELRSPRFAAGQILAGRYRVESLIGVGATGAVYEAEDLERRGRVALRTIPVELARDPAAPDRFQREILAAAEVVHPNICRIVGLGFHGDAGPGAVGFVAMELLSGETLAARIRRCGPLTREEAEPLVAQLGDALDAAHAAGTVHRGLTPGGVVLVPHQGGAIRAVVTGLGLAPARPLALPGGVSPGAGGLAAVTPAYLAPEQVEGLALTPAVDVYALGAVMYEMATGHPPFEAETPIATAVQRLSQPPPSPRDRVAGLDPRWNDVIVRCLARKPAHRFRRAGDVARALRGERVAPLRSEALTRRGLAAAVAAVLIVAAAAALWRGSPSRSSQVPLRPSVAVVGFRNQTGRADASWVSVALSEMLATELTMGGRVRTVPGADVARMKRELGLAEPPDLQLDALSRIHAHSGADLVVSGSYSGDEGAAGRLRVELRAQETEGGQTRLAFEDSGSESELLALAGRVGERLRRGLGAGDPTAGEGLRAAFPAIPEAVRLHAEGLAALRGDDALRASDLLAHAARIEPGKPLLHSALADAWMALGYPAKARDEADAAYEESDRLPRELHLRVEAHRHEVALEWARAAELYAALRASFPDDVEYGIRLAAARREAGEPAAALEAIAQLRQLPRPAGDDPRIDLEEAASREALSDAEAQLAAARRAEAGANLIGARLLVAHARLRQGSALARLADPARASEAYGQARSAYEAVGDRGGVVEALRRQAALAWQQGDGATTKRVGDMALRLARETGDERAVGACLRILAVAHAEERERERATELYQEWLEVCRRVGDKEGLVRGLTSLGALWVERGELLRARPLYEDALGKARALGDKALIAAVLAGLGVVARLEAELPAAQRVYDEALALLEEAGRKSGSAAAHLGRGHVQAASGDLAGARRHYEAALALGRELQDRRGEGESGLALAGLCVEQDRAAEGETLAREVLAGAGARKDEALEAAALEVLARALLAQGRTAEARTAIQQATDRQAAGELEVRGRIRLTASSVRAAAGDSAGALNRLNAELEEARTSGLTALQLEIRLTLGELEMATGHLSAGRTRLEALERDAAGLGFAALARKATLAREPRPARPSPGHGPRRRASQPRASASRTQANSAADF